MFRRKVRTFQPRVDGLEPKVVMSVTHATPFIASRASTVGWIKGTYSAPYDNRPADEPLSMELTGSGRMKNLGKVSMTGSLRMGGFLIQGTPDPTGTITLTNRRGSVTIALAGDEHTRNSPGSGLRLNATVRGGTGAYRNLRWSGAARLDLGTNMLAGFAPIRGSLGLTLQTAPRST